MKGPKGLRYEGVGRGLHPGRRGKRFFKSVDSKIGNLIPIVFAKIFGWSGGKHCEAPEGNQYSEKRSRRDQRFFTVVLSEMVWTMLIPRKCKFLFE